MPVSVLSSRYQFSIIMSSLVSACYSARVVVSFTGGRLDKLLCRTV